MSCGKDHASGQSENGILVFFSIGMSRIENLKKHMCGTTVGKKGENPWYVEKSQFSVYAIPFEKGSKQNLLYGV